MELAALDLGHRLQATLATQRASGPGARHLKPNLWWNLLALERVSSTAERQRHQPPARNGLGETQSQGATRRSGARAWARPWTQAQEGGVPTTYLTHRHLDLDCSTSESTYPQAKTSHRKSLPGPTVPTSARTRLDTQLAAAERVDLFTLLGPICRRRATAQWEARRSRHSPAKPIVTLSLIR